MNLELPATGEKAVETWEYEAIARCGRCGLTEREHQYSTGTDQEAIAVLAALGGACQVFQVSRHAVAKVARQSRVPRRAVRCTRCGGAGHDRANCPW